MSLRIRSALGVSSLLASTLVASASGAVQQPPGLRGDLEVANGVAPIRADVLVRHGAPPPSKSAAWAGFLAAAGSREWHAIWDAATGAPLRIWGKGIAMPGAVHDAAQAEQHARRTLERFAHLLAPGVALADFEIVANHEERGLRTVAFAQRAQVAGRPVEVRGAQVSFRFKNDRLIVIGSEAVPGVTAGPVTIGAERAASAARAWLGAGARAEASSAETVLLPLMREDAFELRTTLRVSATLGPRPYEVYIDAATGEPVARRLLWRFAGAEARFDVPLRAPQAERALMEAPRLLLDVDGAATTTDATGAFAWTGATPATATLGVSGTRVRVLNGDSATATGIFPIDDGGAVAWSLADDEMGDAQLSAFIHTGIAKERARIIAPAMSQYLDQKLTANVNGDDSDYACNAFWNGSTINFFRSFQPCNNTARLADVVYHEFGHAFHQHAVITGAGGTDAALGEGSSDYYAATITNDPVLAPGFYLGAGELRELETVYRWPDDIDWDPHQTGLIYAGAMWSLRTYLQEDLGPAAGVALADVLNYAALQRASSIPATYAEILAADDDDGDLANGTPHLCTIHRAFVPHGLTPYLNEAGLRLVHEAAAVIPPAIPYTFRVETESLHPQCAGDALSSVSVRWRYAQGPSKTLKLTPQGDAYTGVLEAIPAGGALRYEVRASSPVSTVSLPDNRADDEYRVFSGVTRELYCTSFDDGKDGFTFGDDSSGPGDFLVGEPHGLGGDPAMAFSGTSALGQVFAGTGEYKKNRTSFADSPVVDLKGEKHVRLQFRRWLGVQDGYFDQAIVAVNGEEHWNNDGTDPSDGSLAHVDLEWRFEDIDLEPLIDEGATTAQVRFALTSDSRTQRGGWTIDDLCIVAWDPPVVAELPDAGAPDAGEPAVPAALRPGGGCACEAGGPPSSGAWALGVAGAIGVLAARRRRRG